MLEAGAETYSIDLRRDESHRWLDVIAAERATARRLFDEAAAVFEKVPALGLREVVRAQGRALPGRDQSVVERRGCVRRHGGHAELRL